MNEKHEVQRSADEVYKDASREELVKDNEDYKGTTRGEVGLDTEGWKGVSRGVVRPDEPTVGTDESRPA